MKFGGGILKSQENLARVAGIVKTRSSRRNVLVVSAANGVTDQLIASLENGFEGEQEVDSFIELLRTGHETLLPGISKEPAFTSALEHLRRLLFGVHYTQESSPRVRSLVLSFGERLSSIVVARRLALDGIPALEVSSEDAGIVAVERFSSSFCDFDATQLNAGRLVSLLSSGILPVVTGFYGVDSSGGTVLFGRGGTDYSSGILARVLGADVLEIWKDVPGFLTSDPRIIPSARKLEEMSFNEAEELGYFGAKILHPRTVECLRGRKTRVEILSVFEPGAGGTRIIEEREYTGASAVSSVSCKKGISVVSVSGGAMVEVPGVLGTLFNTLASNGIVVDCVSTSQVVISFTIYSRDLPKTLEVLDSLKGSLIEEVRVVEDAALIAVVGEGFRSTQGIAARIFGSVARADVNVVMLMDAASNNSISFVTSSSQAHLAVEAVYREFELYKVPQSSSGLEAAAPQASPDGVESRGGANG